MKSEFFDNLDRSIDNVNTCAQLQALSDSLSVAYQELLDEARDKMTQLEALTTAPTDLPSVITWITHAISQFSGPLATYTAQVTYLLSRSVTTIAKIESKISTLGCSFPPPSVS
jgi:hypothetical protein